MSSDKKELFPAVIEESRHSFIPQQLFPKELETKHAACNTHQLIASFMREQSNIHISSQPNKPQH